MQVAKYWRRNQLRYQLQGIAQDKAKVAKGSKPVDISSDELHREKKTKVA